MFSEPFEADDFGVHLTEEIVFLVLIFEAPQHERVGVHADGGDWGAEFVGDLRDEAGLERVVAVLPDDEDEGQDGPGHAPDGEGRCKNAQGDVAAGLVGSQNNNAGDEVGDGGEQGAGGDDPGDASERPDGLVCFHDIF